MPSFAIRRVPDDQVQTWVSRYKRRGATDVQIVSEGGGRSTLNVTFPDEQTHAELEARAASAPSPGAVQP
jgi:hypothetical protein